MSILTVAPLFGTGSLTLKDRAAKAITGDNYIIQSNDILCKKDCNDLQEWRTALTKPYRTKALLYSISCNN